MFGFIKKLFGAKPVETVAEAPSKVEEVMSAPVVKEVVAVVAEAKPAKAKAKKPAAKKQQFAKKPAAAKKPKVKPAK